MAKERTIEKIKRAIKRDFAKLTKPISHSKKDLKRIVIDGRTYVRSFSENKGVSFPTLQVTATMTLSKICTALSMISRCPLVMGSKEPG